jgi:hypothetical protein
MSKAELRERIAQHDSRKVGDVVNVIDWLARLSYEQNYPEQGRLLGAVSDEIEHIMLSQ